MNQDDLSNLAEGPVACLPSPFLYLLTRHEGSPSASGFPSKPVDAVNPVNECFSKKVAHCGSNMIEHSQVADPAQFFFGQHSSKTIRLLQAFRALCSDL